MTINIKGEEEVSKKKPFTGVQWVEVMRDGDKTFAFGIYSDGKMGRIPFVGMADRNVEEDRENATRGRDMAIGRAFEKLGKEIQKREWNKMKNVTPVNQPKKLSEAEKAALKAKPEAVAKRKERATKNDKASAKTPKTTAKSDSKTSKASKNTPSK
jgi:hypothetical protein